MTPADATTTDGERASGTVGSLATERASRPTLSAWVRLARPRQWTKNFFVLTPLLFSGRALSAGAELRAFGAFVVFCAVASAVYAMNDVLDVQRDRAHPVKRRRPVAAGEVSVAGALIFALGLAVGALVLALRIQWQTAALAAGYVGLNIVYSIKLKNVVILDVFAIAAFFLIRLLAGATAIGVRPSIWLLLCGGLLALYLGFAKRRHELHLLGADSASHREVLTLYSTAFLDQVSTVLLAVTAVSYIMYTLNSPTARQVGSEALAYSTAFVLYGMFRYLYLSLRRGGGDPAETLLTDRYLLADVLLWFAYCAYIVYR